MARADQGEGPRTEAGSVRVEAHADASLPPAGLEPALLAEVYAHARECYPEECCGLLLGPAGRAPARVVRCTNVQSLRHSSGVSDLEARHGFWIDESELLRALAEAERSGSALRAIYHSHVDARAYLSRADLDAAIGPDGRPHWPGVAHVVVSVCDGLVREAAWFDWDPGDGAFVGRPLAERR